MAAFTPKQTLRYARGLHRAFGTLLNQHCTLLTLLINKEIITKEEFDEAIKETEALRSVEKEFNPAFQKLKAIEDAIDKYLNEEGDSEEGRT